MARSIIGLTVVLLLVACGGDTTAPGADAAADALGDAQDLGVPEAPPADTPAQDAPPADTPRDSATDTAPQDTSAPDAMDATEAPDAPSRCRTDADCAGNPLGGACDTASGRCVGCVPTMDRCPAAQHCDGATMTCAPGCRGDEGCDGDAGAGRRCDTAAHRCVECVMDAHCAPGTLCVGSTCVAGCNATRPCPTGQQCCAGACVDTLSSLAHCGGCDRRCETPNATAACRNGVCAVGTCTAPFADCDMSAANGCEASTLTDARHCGGCGVACATRPNSVSRCAAGRCEHTCNEGFADCDADPSTGCEADTRVSLAHCGGCGRACAPPSAAGACAAGRCAVATCNAGFGDCDGNASNGCEVDTRATAAHCGRCGGACPTRPNSFPGCVASACVVSCVAGFAECDGDASNGCEAELGASALHCGGCGRPCATGAGTASNPCVRGTCAPACAEGFGDCDANPGNGCEANLRTDPRNCGACGRAPAELCNAMDDDCDGMIDEGLPGCTAAEPAASCLDILNRGASRGDGEYFIRVGGAAVRVHCLMSADGGGWTLVGNFPYPGGTAGVPGWNSGARVGADLSNLSRPFKLSDAEINALRTNGFRARGTASRCCCIPGVGTGGCAVDTTLFWRATCAYASGTSSPACAEAFLDPGFTRPSPAGTSPCGHHWGLTSVTCGTTSAMGTSHSGEHVFVGEVTGFIHAYDGRAGEDPTVRFWVR